jgi:hypothetical protein
VYKKGSFDLYYDFYIILNVILQQNVLIHFLRSQKEVQTRQKLFLFEKKDGCLFCVNKKKIEWPFDACVNKTPHQLFRAELTKQIYK